MISIILPTLNESQNLPSLLSAIQEHLDQDFEIIVVDDNSSDGSATVARTCHPNLKVTVIERTGVRDLGLSVLEGIELAGGDYLLIMDADLSHDPSHIPEMVAKLQSEARFVTGSRYLAQSSMLMPLPRRLLARVGRFLAQGLSKSSDPFSGYFALLRNDMPEIPKRALGFKIGLEIQVRGGFNSVDIPIVFKPRRWGRSKINVYQTLKIIRHLFCLYFYCFTQKSSLSPTKIKSEPGVIA
jgi:dolichol-phosphate mannosyltransferase